MKINIKHIITIIAFTVASSACTEEVSNDIFTGKPVIVINGLITNEPGPYFVRVTKSNSTLSDFNDNNSSGSSTLTTKDGRIIHEPITNAIVTITDNEGNTDVLKPSDDESSYGGTETWSEFGFYETTTDLVGKPGNIYTITVEHEGKTYTAKSEMPPTPPIIDKVDFVWKILTSGQPQPYPIPVISFDEPQDRVNYYRFLHFNAYNNSTTTDYNLQSLLFDDVIILDDEFLGPRVDDLSFDAALVEGQGLDPIFGDSVLIYSYALEERVYRYYQDLQQQIRSDGGAFSPSPASPRNNLSNGALGLWQASSVSVKKVKSPEWQ